MYIYSHYIHVYFFLMIDFSGFEDNMVSLYGSIIIIMIKW